MLKACVMRARGFVLGLLSLCDAWMGVRVFGESYKRELREMDRRYLGERERERERERATKVI